jgi:hypothetical protein
VQLTAIDVARHQRPQRRADDDRPSSCIGNTMLVFRVALRMWSIDARYPSR